jgi:hypothetical protein
MRKLKNHTVPQECSFQSPVAANVCVFSGRLRGLPHIATAVEPSC